MRCPTSQGSFRCAREVGHAGDCETESRLGASGKIVVLEHDAAHRIALLEAALRVIRTTFCSSPVEGAACDCCRHMRELASGALGEP
jgi:hypothetical protein